MTSTHAAGGQLKGADALLLRQLLDEACSQVTTELNWTDDQKRSLQERCEAVAKVLTSHEHQDGPVDDAMQEDAVLEDACSQDSDVVQLHQQVTDAAQRIQELKTSAPHLLAQSAQQHMSAQRPVSKGVLAARQLAAMSEDMLAGSVGAAPSTDSASQAEYTRLRQQLTGLMDQLPGLRMQLEHSEQRLSVNMMAIESEPSRASPYTAERMPRDSGVGAARRPLVQHSPPPAMARLGSLITDKAA